MLDLPGPAGAVVRRLRRLSPQGLPVRPGLRLAAALQEMGPAFVKLGQSLATRADLLGVDAADDLRLLQDRLPTFEAAVARATIEAELGAPVDRLFAAFDDVPVAAASIAQVHRARTPDGRVVAVKVLRPGIEAEIEGDLRFFAWAAALVERLVPALRWLRPVETMAVFARSTRGELDLRLEAAAAAEFAANMEDDAGFRVPAVDWERTASRVLTLEWIDGLRPDDRAGLDAAGLDRGKILEASAVFFFNQVFRDGFFHGDMHPGNTRIDVVTGDVIALDFGIMGRLDMATRRHLAEILSGFLMRDFSKVADVFFRAGFIPAGQDREGFAQACRAIAEPILDRPLEEISLARVMGQLLVTAERFAMQGQPNLLLLQKTMVVAEGVGRALDPSMNTWSVAQPLVRGWMVRHMGPWAEVARGAQSAAEGIARLPGLVRRLEARLDEAAALQRVRPGLAWAERALWFLAILATLVLVRALD